MMMMMADPCKREYDGARAKQAWRLTGPASFLPLSPPLMDAQSRERGEPHFGYSVLSVFGRPPAAAGWKKSDDSCQQK